MGILPPGLAKYLANKKSSGITSQSGLNKALKGGVSAQSNPMPMRSMTVTEPVKKTVKKKVTKGKIKTTPAQAAKGQKNYHGGK